MDIQNIIQTLKAYNPQKVLLFGSYATGTAHGDSDIDIAIIKDTTLSYHDRLIEVRRLLRTTTPIDIFVFTQQEIRKSQDTNPFIHEIMTHGTVMYEQ